MNERPALFSLGALTLLAAACCAGCTGASHSLMAVNVSLADLRAKPQTTAAPNTHDPLEETQLLYGEQVRVVSTENGWAKVEAVEQPEFTHANRWQGYPGWLPASDLRPWQPLLAPTIVVVEAWAPSFQNAFGMTPSPWRFPLGARLRATDMGGQLWKAELLDGSVVWIPRQYVRALDELRRLSPIEQRRAILRAAERLVGEPYYWGGRSPAIGGSADTADRAGHPAAGGVGDGSVEGRSPSTGGVDCSGLVNLAYRAAGIDIPRDAHEQFLRAKAARALQPADLVFLSERSNPKRIVHVMLYAGNGEVIEGPGTGKPVRRIAIVRRLGLPSLERLSPGMVVNGQTVSFGTYLP